MFINMTTGACQWVYSPESSIQFISAQYVSLLYYILRHCGSFSKKADYTLVPCKETVSFIRSVNLGWWCRIIFQHLATGSLKTSRWRNILHRGSVREHKLNMPILLLLCILITSLNDDVVDSWNFLPERNEFLEWCMGNSILWTTWI